MSTAALIRCSRSSRGVANRPIYMFAQRLKGICVKNWKMTFVGASGYRSLWPLLLAVLLFGCSGETGPQRYRVSGSVTHKGAPVPIGVIQFTPDATKGNSGPPAFADIKDGKYDTQVSGKGFIGGPQIVAIDAFSGKNVDPDLLPSGEPIMVGYQKAFDLPKDQDVTLDIELTEK